MGGATQEADGSAVRADAAPFALEISALSKTFGPVKVLSDLDLTIAPGEIHALVGENGSGKSTAIKILSGYHVPDHGGRVLMHGQPLDFGSAASSYERGLRFVHQDVGLVDSCSVLDNLLLTSGFPTSLGTIRGRSAVHEAKRDLARVGLDLNPKRLVERLTPSQKVGIAIARAIRSNDQAPVRALVLDEPTSMLPVTEVENLLAILREAAGQGIGVLYVSHRIDELFEIAQQVTVLRDGVVVARKPIAELDHRSLVHLLVGREFEQVAALTRGVHVADAESVLSVDELSADSVHSFSLSAHAGEIVGVAGLTGSGRESVLPAIFGATPNSGGTVTVAGVRMTRTTPGRAMAAGMTYLPRDRRRQGGILGFSARENIALTDVKRSWRFPRLIKRMEREETREWFHKLDVRPASGVEKPLGSFSGGNQQKVVLAKLLRRSPRVLLLDEPTQGVDAGAKALIHRQIVAAAEAGCAVVVCSVEDEELVALCHRVLVLRHGRCATELSGEELTTSALAAATLIDATKVGSR